MPGVDIAWAVSGMFLSMRSRAHHKGSGIQLIPAPMKIPGKRRFLNHLSTDDWAVRVASAEVILKRSWTRVLCLECLCTGKLPAKAAKPDDSRQGMQRDQCKYRQAFLKRTAANRVFDGLNGFSIEGPPGRSKKMR